MRRSRILRITTVLLSTAVLSGYFFQSDRSDDETLRKMRVGIEDSASKSIAIGDAVVRKTLDGTAFQAPQSLIYKTDRVNKPMPTNDWWSSAAWRPFTGAMYPHPLAVKGYPDGLGIAYPDIRVRPNSYQALYSDSGKDILVGGEDLIADATLVDGFGDWSVDLLFENDERNKRMRVTLAHGSPYIYYAFEQTKPVLRFSAEPEWFYGSADQAVIGVTVNGHHYAFFAPSGTTWSQAGDSTLLADMPKNKGYLSMALLPDNKAETLNKFAEYAYSFITDTRVTWNYDEKSSLVKTNYEAATTAMEGKRKGTLFALYPHQWKHTDAPFLPYTYKSPRGEMKIAEGRSFITEMTYHGILPYLPNIGTDETQLNALMDEFMADQPLMKPSPEAEGTYWYGKNYGRLSQALQIAKQLNRSKDKEALMKAIQIDMETAFGDTTAGKRLTYYDAVWGTLNVYPTQFGADLVLNDHHFHYGYWVYAAAMLAYEDPEWASPDRYGGMIELLIRDYADWDRSDESEKPLFPFLRTFDPYAGHSWASGEAADGSGYSPGNNQESSSEAIQAAAAMILWGDATGNREIRDTGIYLYTTETEAVRQYWFDVDGENFPEGYEFGYAPLVFSSGAEYRTWWTNNPEEVRLINALPFTGASLYLGWNPEYVQSNYERMIKENGGPEQEWKDLIWMYEAFYDPDTALSKMENEPFESEFGESAPHAYQWIANMKELGRVDPSVIADTPMYAAFLKDGKRTFIAYNGFGKEIKVTFKAAESTKKLVELKVPPKSIRYVQLHP
ncbi:glycosyl hydrolase [Cohnella suwonensis]|uniref:glucan endo-1,3-beta-D-glucosidase n=1 Tax=Cohnella suwonensis TaxID=696072 RepID=A0ABW0LRB0_9BACL